MYQRRLGTRATRTSTIGRFTQTSLRPRHTSRRSVWSCARQRSLLFLFFAFGIAREDKTQLAVVVVHRSRDPRSLIGYHVFSVCRHRLNLFCVSPACYGLIWGGFLAGLWDHKQSCGRYADAVVITAVGGMRRS